VALLVHQVAALATSLSVLWGAQFVIAENFQFFCWSLHFLTILLFHQTRLSWQQPGVSK